ncbi:MAG: acetyl-CoA carboxylase biotin carboxyl carrier protein [Pseudonocardiaceae bacterium]
MNDDIRSGSEEELRALCQEAISLVQRLPGPVRRVVVRSSDHTVEVEWPVGDATPVPVVGAQPSAPASATPAPAPDQPLAADAGDAAHVVRAPLVGTVYRAPQPDADPFVSVGDIVEVGQTIAIVEAMKLLNHIVTEVAGRVVEICVRDGEPVEFEQPLMRILPLVDGEAARKE